MADAKHREWLAEEAGDTAGAVVSHHALDLDAAGSEPTERADEEACGRRAPLVGEDLDIRARRVASSVATCVVADVLTLAGAIAGDAVADFDGTGEAS
jgi:hypothetical protein